MRFLSKALLGMLPAALLGISAAGAAEPGWKHSCVGPEVACSSSSASGKPEGGQCHDA